MNAKLLLKTAIAALCGALLSPAVLWPVGAQVGAGSPPLIVSQPQSRTVNASSNVTFRVTVTGDEPLAYRWFKDGTLLATATNSFLALTNVKVADQASFMVVISNAAGVATSTVAALKVIDPPVITRPPADQYVNPGGSGAFAVIAAGAAPLAYQWFFCGQPLTNSARISGSTTSRLTISNVGSNDAGPYLVVLTNQDGAATSAVARLFINTPPVIIMQPPSSQVEAVSNTVRLCADATGTPPPTYQWRKDGVNLANDSRLGGATNQCLMITNVSASDAGNYTVAVYTPMGTATSSNSALAVEVRSLRLRPAQVDTNGTAILPLELVGQGNEHTFLFSLAYDPAVLAFVNATNSSALTNAAVAVDTSLTATGKVGLTLILPSGTNFSANTNVVLANLEFRPLGTNALRAFVVFADEPLPRQVLDETTTNTLPAHYVEGLITIPGAASEFIAPTNMHFGLFGQTVTLSHPQGTVPGQAVRILFYDLGVDSRGNKIQVKNAAGVLADGTPYLLYRWPLGPAQSIELTVEYYVADRITQPNPRLVVEVVPAPAPPQPAGNLVPTISGYYSLGAGGLTFVLNFLSSAGKTYYVQYVNSLTNTNWTTILPPLTGNGGYRQWIDTGPPQTESKAPAGGRFYRVREP